MDEQITKYIDNLVNEVLQIPVFAILKKEDQTAVADKLKDHFYSLVFATILESMNDAQVMELKNTDLTSQEGLDKLQVIAASIPGLAEEVDSRLKKAQDQILTTQKVPEVTLNI